jgi:hypothetical protein
MIHPQINVKKSKKTFDTQRSWFYSVYMDKQTTELNSLGGFLMDFVIAPFDFDSTECCIMAKSQSAKDFLADKFGAGASSLNVMKSAVPRIMQQFEDAGFKFSII